MGAAAQKLDQGRISFERAGDSTLVVHLSGPWHLQRDLPPISLVGFVYTVLRHLLAVDEKTTRSTSSHLSSVIGKLEANGNLACWNCLFSPNGVSGRGRSQQEERIIRSGPGRRTRSQCPSSSSTAPIS